MAFTSIWCPVCGSNDTECGCSAESQTKKYKEIEAQRSEFLKNKTPEEWKEYIKSKYKISNNSDYDQIVTNAFHRAMEQAREDVIEKMSKMILRSTVSTCPLDCRISWVEQIRMTELRSKLEK